MKKKYAGIACLTVLSFLLSACFVEFDPSDVQREPARGSFSGTLTGSERGYAGTITVTLTLSNGEIRNAVVEHTETPSYGGVLINNAQGPNGLIVNSNGFNYLTPQAISGSTITGNALRAAGESALAGAR